MTDTTPAPPRALMDAARMFAPLKPIGGPELPLLTPEQIAEEWGCPDQIRDALVLLAQANPIAWSNKNRDTARQQLETLKRAWTILFRFQRGLHRDRLAVLYPLTRRAKTISTAPPVFAIRSDLTGSDAAQMLRFDQRIADVPVHIRHALCAPWRDEASSEIQAALGKLKGLIEALGERVHG